MASVLKAFPGNLGRTNGLRVKPQGICGIDWAKAPRGLLICALAGEGGIVDLVSRRVPKYSVGGSAGTSHKNLVTPYGIGWNPQPPGGSEDCAYFTVGPYWTASSPDFSLSGPASMELWVWSLGLNTSGAILAAVEEAVPLSNTDDKKMFFDTSGAINFYIYDGNVENASGGTGIAGRWKDSTPRLFHIVGVSDPAGAACRLYINGVQAGSIGAAGSYQAFVNPVFVFGGGNFNSTSATNNSDPTSVILMANLSHVTWTPQEVAQRYADPYGFLITEEMPELKSLGAGPTFLPAWATGHNKVFDGVAS